MLTFRFTKSLAEKTLTAIQNGKAIPAPPDRWSQNELLQVAGVLCLAAISRDSTDLSNQPFEYCEARGETLCEDIREVIDVHSHLAKWLMLHVYDELYAADVIGKVWQEDGGSSHDFDSGVIEPSDKRNQLLRIIAAVESRIESLTAMTAGKKVQDRIAASVAREIKSLAELKDRFAKQLGNKKQSEN